MPSPFPGMDPYIERPEIWPDFHDSLIAAIRGLLQPRLRPRYVALTQDRLYVVESDRPIRPDVSVVRTPRSDPAKPRALTADVDTPVVFELEPEEVRQPLLHIIEPAAGNRLVTAIEVLSPDNKSLGAGRKSYLRKRKELWEGGANLVEIDLLHGGLPTVRLSPKRLEALQPWRYIVLVTRCSPRQQEVYAWPLDRPLPRIAVPLAEGDQDVPLDMTAALARCWDEGPYPELLHYDAPLPGDWTEVERQWCQQILQQAGRRSG